jgi:uncharacterized protein YjbI with pentapeptide repeats
MGAQLHDAILQVADLRRTTLLDALLEQTDLREARLDSAILDSAHLEGTHLGKARLNRASLAFSHLEGATLAFARLKQANLAQAHREGASLREAHLERANHSEAHLEGTQLYAVRFEWAVLQAARLEGKYLNAQELASIQKYVSDFPAKLPPANLREAFFDTATNLQDMTTGTAEHGFVCLLDVRWGGVNLAPLKWTHQPRKLLRNRTRVPTLGDERIARRFPPRSGAERGHRTLS